MMTLKIGRRLTVGVAGFADASDRYCEARDASGEGASTFPEGRVMKGRKTMARISYNGRIWFAQSIIDMDAAITEQMTGGVPDLVAAINGQKITFLSRDKRGRR